MCFVAGVDLLSTDIGGNVPEAPNPEATTSDLLAQGADLSASDVEISSTNACKGGFAPEVLRMRGSTSHMHARHVTQAAAASAANSVSGGVRHDDSDQDSTQSIAVSSEINALHVLTECICVDAAATVPLHRVQQQGQDRMHAVEGKDNKQSGSQGNSFLLGCTPSLGSTGSGPAGALTGGGMSQGPWRGVRDITDSYIMHTLHARSDGPPLERCGQRVSLDGDVHEVEGEGPCEEACMHHMHGDDIDEIDDTSTQLSERSGSWLCLPAPPPVAHGGHAVLTPGAVMTGSMHLSASMNLGGDTTLDRASTNVCRVASSWLVAFGGNACGPHVGGIGSTVLMGRNSSVASHSEVAV